MLNPSRVGGMACVLLVGGLVTIGAGAEIETVVEAGVYSAFVDRGRVVNDRPVFQPALALNIRRDFSLSAWGNFDLTDRNGRKNEFVEVDLEATVAFHGFDPAGLEIGMVQRHFPRDNADSVREAFFALTGLADFPVWPGLTVYADLEEPSAVYATVELTGTWKIRDRTGLDLGVSSGVASKAYNRRHFEQAVFALNDLNLWADLDLALSDVLSLTISAQVTFLPDGPIRAASRSLYADDRAVVAGILLSGVF